MAQYYLGVDFTASFDEDLEIINYETSIQLVDMERETEITIGKALFNLYNSDFFEDWTDVVLAADGVSGIDQEVVSTLNYFRNDDEIYGRIVVLNTLQIDMEYRNQGWGSEALRMILDYLKYHGVEYFALKPAPLDNKITDKERKNRISRLIKFYNKFGLKTLQKKNQKEPCMGMNLNY